MNREEMIERAKQAFGKLIEEDLDRIEGRIFSIYPT